MRFRRAMTGVVLGAALAAGAPATFASPAQAEPALIEARRCGFYTEPYNNWYDTGWYDHCAQNQVCIKVDVRQGVDYIKEVGPGVTFLGWGIRNAYYVGLPHPTLRCRIWPV